MNDDLKRAILHAIAQAKTTSHAWDAVNALLSASIADTAGAKPILSAVLFALTERQKGNVIRSEDEYVDAARQYLAAPSAPSVADAAGASDAQDAARYRWLVKNCFDWAAPGDGDSFDSIELHFESEMLSRDDESVGRAIDAEIAKEPK
jgi:hypothetical protein